MLAAAVLLSKDDAETACNDDAETAGDPMRGDVEGGCCTEIGVDSLVDDPEDPDKLRTVAHRVPVHLISGTCLGVSPFFLMYPRACEPLMQLVVYSRL